MSGFEEYVTPIDQRLRTVPTYWNGKKSILEMKMNNFNQWKQMEWIGFYFEYLCRIKLKDIMLMPFEKKYGNVTFDGFYKFPWDFKSHAIESGNKIIVNDEEATCNAIEEFGQVGLILANGTVEYDNDQREFQKWHEEIKGGETEYEKERKKRGAASRLRKISFKLKKIMIIGMTKETLTKSSSFQNDFRNSNGRPRRKKVLLDLTELRDNQVHLIE